jgi:hypothetical protein
VVCNRKDVVRALFNAVANVNAKDWEGLMAIDDTHGEDISSADKAELRAIISGSRR